MRSRSVLFGLAMTAAIFLLVWLVWPVYKGISSEGVNHATPLQVNGWWVIVPVMLPCSSRMCRWWRARQAVRIIATVVMGGFVLISGFSVGPFYLPGVSSCYWRLVWGTR